jgi:hypothetical protein
VWTHDTGVGHAKYWGGSARCATADMAPQRLLSVQAALVGTAYQAMDDVRADSVFGQAHATSYLSLQHPGP